MGHSSVAFFPLLGNWSKRNWGQQLSILFSSASQSPGAAAAHRRFLHAIFVITPVFLLSSLTWDSFRLPTRPRVITVEALDRTRYWAQEFNYL
jgi:hypothetical protein